MKPLIKKILKIIGISILTVIGFTLLYLGCAYCLSRITVNEDAIAGNDVEIFILSNGVHTDIVMPINNEQIRWSDHIKLENTIGKDSSSKYIALGWGDKGFYLETPTWADLKFSTAFKAAFALSKSAIHATYYQEIIEGENCKRIVINKQQYQKLIDFISDSFEKNEDGRFIHIQTKANYGNNDAFYEATGSYSLFHTCNTWTNNALKSCEQKASLWTPFDTGIFCHYQDQ